MAVNADGETNLSPSVPVTLACITAMVDVLGWLQLDHLYTANITGDLTQSVSYILPYVPAHALQLLAVPVFLVGLTCAYTVVRRWGDQALRAITVAQGLLLLAVVVIAETATLSGGRMEPGGVAIGLLAILTIALSNAAMAMLDPKAATTWALTANTVHASVALLDLATGRGDAAERRATFHAIWPTVLAFLVGGIVAVATMRVIGTHAWLLPMASSFAAALWLPIGRHAAPHS